MMWLKPRVRLGSRIGTPFSALGLSYFLLYCSQYRSFFIPFVLLALPVRRKEVWRQNGRPYRKTATAGK